MKSTVIQTRSYVPLHIKGEAVPHLSSLTQFHGIADQALIRLAKRRTGLRVPDRWVAIALILGNYIPIPVASPGHRKNAQATEGTPPPKLRLIRGGRIGR